MHRNKQLIEGKPDEEKRKRTACGAIMRLKQKTLFLKRKHVDRDFSGCVKEFYSEHGSNQKHQAGVVSSSRKLCGCIIYVLVSPIVSSSFVILECTDILNCPSIYTYRVVCFGVKPNFTRFLHPRTCFTKVELNPICPQILTPHKLHGFQCIVHGTGEKNRVHSMRRAF